MPDLDYQITLLKERVEFNDSVQKLLDDPPHKLAMYSLLRALEGALREGLETKEKDFLPRVLSLLRSSYDPGYLTSRGTRVNRLAEEVQY